MQVLMDVPPRGVKHVSMSMEDLEPIRTHLLPKFGIPTRVEVMTRCIVFCYKSVTVTVYPISYDLALNLYLGKEGSFEYSYDVFDNYKYIAMKCNWTTAFMDEQKGFVEFLEMVNCVDMVRWCFSTLYGFSRKFQVVPQRVKFFFLEDDLTSAAGYMVTQIKPLRPIPDGRTNARMEAHVIRLFECCYAQMLDSHRDAVVRKFLHPTDQLVRERLGMHSEFAKIILDTMLYPDQEIYVFDINSYALDVLFEYAHLIMNKDRAFARKVFSFLVMACNLNGKFAREFIEMFKAKNKKAFENQLENYRVEIEPKEKFTEVEKSINSASESDEDTDNEDELRNPALRRNCWYYLAGIPVKENEPMKPPFWHFVKIYVIYGKCVKIFEAREEAKVCYQLQIK